MINHMLVLWTCDTCHAVSTQTPPPLIYSSPNDPMNFGFACPGCNAFFTITYNYAAAPAISSFQDANNRMMNAMAAQYTPHLHANGTITVGETRSGELHQAQGTQLDIIGHMLGTTRMRYESDTQYRARLINVTTNDTQLSSGNQFTQTYPFPEQEVPANARDREHTEAVIKEMKRQEELRMAEWKKKERKNRSLV